MTEDRKSATTIAKLLRAASGRGLLLLVGPVGIQVEPNSGRDMYGVAAVTHDKTARDGLFERFIYFGAVANVCDDCAAAGHRPADGDEITAAEAILAHLLRDDGSPFPASPSEAQAFEMVS